MPSYQVRLNIEAERMPDLGPQPDFVASPGDLNPIEKMLPDAMNMLKTIARAPVMSFGGPPPGISLRRSFTVNAESFKALCEMLERFDSLAEQVECSHPAE